MPLLKKRTKQPSLTSWMISGSSGVPAGYRRLVDAPAVSSCINRMAALVASCPIYLMENTDGGDRRVHDDMSRLVDIDPVPGMMTRYLWMNWIVSNMLSDGDGNSYVLPNFGNRFSLCSLDPMSGARFTSYADVDSLEYAITWRGRIYDRTEVLHFRLHADPAVPTKGRGYQVQAQDIAASLANIDALKNNLSSPDYKPPLIVGVNSDAPLDDEADREEFRKHYMSDGDGKPWILPVDLMQVQQLKPLSLADLAVKDTIDIDKRTACAIFGMPPFLLGIGTYSQKEFNNFIHSVILPICVSIEQELTSKLLPDRPKQYFKFSRRRLYEYDLETLIKIDLAMADRGYLNGDEVRDDADRDPAGLTDFKVLENYIPYDMSGKQNKLNQED